MFEGERLSGEVVSGNDWRSVRTDSCIKRIVFLANDFSTLRTYEKVHSRGYENPPTWRQKYYGMWFLGQVSVKRGEGHGRDMRQFLAIMVEPRQRSHALDCGYEKP